MGRHSSPTPPDAYPTRPDRDQDRGGVGTPTVAPTTHDVPTDAGTAPPTVAAPEVEGWPAQLADQPFGWEAAADLAAVPTQPRREEHATEPTGGVDQREEHTPPDRTPTEVERAEEEHLDWLRHLPERRDEVPAGQHPPAHGRADPPPQRETPGREWIERLVVGLVAGLVTFAATRWAGAGWSTAAAIGATVLVVVPTAAWVATLGSRSPSSRRSDREPEH